MCIKITDCIIIHFLFKNKTMHTAYTGLPVFLREKMNFFDTPEKCWQHESNFT